MQDVWTARKAEEIQGYADHNEWKNLFAAIKAVNDLTAKAAVHFLRADRTTLLTEKTHILKRWTEHFKSVSNCSSLIFDAVIASLPQVETNVDLDLPPSLHETIKAMQRLSCSKDPGSDTIPAKICKHGGPTYGTPDGALPGDVASRSSSSGLQGRHYRPPLASEREPPTL
ncbi:hypothetical protein SprV_0501852500 [Sparganum proliferum]